MFTYNETHKIKQYFKENGYVVITNVINDKEIENTINEICTHPALLGEYKFDLKEPSSWGKPHIAEYGFVDVNQGYSQGHSQRDPGYKENFCCFGIIHTIIVTQKMIFFYKICIVYTKYICLFFSFSQNSPFSKAPKKPLTFR